MSIKIKIPDGKDVYDKVQPKAEGIKAIIQMAIGVTSIVALIVQFGIYFGEGMGDAADRALLVIGVALAFSAAVELAYTFFTDGPDEALDPLVLGISAFTLIIISQSKWTDNADAAKTPKGLADTPNLNDISIPVLLPRCRRCPSRRCARHRRVDGDGDAGTRRWRRRTPPCRGRTDTSPVLQLPFLGQ
jgi:hypothetical protein